MVARQGRDEEHNVLSNKEPVLKPYTGFEDRFFTIHSFYYI